MNFQKKINNDSLTLYLTFGKGALYGKLGFHKRGIKIIDECLANSDVIKNKTKRSLFRGDLYTHKAFFITSLNNVASQSALNNYILAMQAYENALESCLDAGYTNVGYCYMELGDYDKAVYYFNKAIQFYKTKNVITPEIEYTNLAEVYFQKEDYTKSKKYADSSIAICLKMKTKNFSLLSNSYKILKNIYIKQDRTDANVKYYNLELLYKDSLNLQNKEQLSTSAKYLISKNETENSALQEKNYYIIFGFGIVILTGIILTFYIIKNKKSQFEQKVFINQKDIEKKSIEIVELKQKVSTSYNDLIEMAKKNDPLFTSFFIELYPEFYQKLKTVQPNLTLVEQKVCFYLKLKFTTKEIAECTFVSVKAIQNRKNRLRKRLYIETDVDIYIWIDQL